MQIHGVHVDKLKARFSGTIDDIDEENFRFGRMVVLLVIGKAEVGSVGEKGKDVEVIGVMNVKVTDMQPLEGDLRDQAVAYMAHGANQGILNFGNPIHPPPKGQAVLDGVDGRVADYAMPPEPPEGVDPETGEVHDPEDEYFDVPPADPYPVTVRPDDVEPPEFKTPEPVSVTADAAPPPADARRVGSVRAHGRADKELEAFLNAE